MRTFFSYFFGVTIALTALLIIPVERLFDEITDTQKLVDNVKTARLYEQIANLTAQKVLEQKPLQNIKTTPFMPSTEEMQKVVKDVFPEDWFLNNVGAVHRDLIGFMADPAADKNHFAGIVITDRKNMLAENLALLMERKINSLPECTPQDLIRLRMSLTVLAKGTGGFSKNFELNCKPPEQVRSFILKSVRKDLDIVMSRLPDSLSLLKQDVSRKDSELGGLKSAYVFSQSFSAIGYGILFFLVAVIVLLNIKNVPKLLQRTGFPFILTSLLMSIPFFFLISESEKIFTTSSMQFKYSESSSDVINNEAAQLVISFIRSSTEHYSWNMVYLCGILFLMGIVMFVVSRVVKLEPLSPLDHSHETNL